MWNQPSPRAWGVFWEVDLALWEPRFARISLLGS